MNQLGTNLSFAVKRWPEPEQWARVVRQELHLSLVQFSFDLLDPWWPSEVAVPLARRVRAACAHEGITLHSAFVGLAHYTYNQLLHPDAGARAAARTWFERAIDLAAEMGAEQVGGPPGGMSVADAADERTVDHRHRELVETLRHLCEHAASRGLKGFLLEPVPLPRELPWTVEQARRLLAELDGAAVPVSYCFDWGHAIVEPVYGPGKASAQPWLQGLGPKGIGAVHLQQSDGQLDRHWSFVEDGVVDVDASLMALRQAGLGNAPVFLEVFFPFEAADDRVLADMKATCQICRSAFNPPG